MFSIPLLLIAAALLRPSGSPSIREEPSNGINKWNPKNIRDHALYRSSQLLHLKKVVSNEISEIIATITRPGGKTKISDDNDDDG